MKGFRSVEIATLLLQLRALRIGSAGDRAAWTVDMRGFLDIQWSFYTLPWYCQVSSLDKLGQVRVSRKSWVRDVRERGRRKERKNIKKFASSA